MTLNELAYHPRVDRVATWIGRLIPRPIRLEIAVLLKVHTRWCGAALISWGMYGNWENLRTAWESRCYENVPEGGCWCGKFDAARGDRAQDDA